MPVCCWPPFESGKRNNHHHPCCVSILLSSFFTIMSDNESFIKHSSGIQHSARRHTATRRKEDRAQQKPWENVVYKSRPTSTRKAGSHQISPWSARLVWETTLTYGKYRSNEMIDEGQMILKDGQFLGFMVHDGMKGLDGENRYG